ncbi:hypothetical protein EON63_19840 [archaeon]|nr:MAG: hypothetical protein EON63_19840 [archaeon]
MNLSKHNSVSGTFINQAMSNDATVQRTLAFIYSRGTKSQETALDPDKHYVSYNLSKAPSSTTTGEVFHPDKAVWDFTGALACLRPDYSSGVYVSWDLPPFPSYEHALQASKVCMGVGMGTDMGMGIGMGMSVCPYSISVCLKCTYQQHIHLLTYSYTYTVISMPHTPLLVCLSLEACR